MTIATVDQAALLPPFRSDPRYASPEGWIRLSLSESAYGSSALARQAVAGELTRTHRYPDPGAGALVARIAELHAVTDEQVMIGNGVDELLLLSAMAFASPDGGVMVCDGTYPGHGNAASAVGQAPHRVPLRDTRVDVAHMIDMVRPGALVYVCNPHNPTGTAIAAADVDALAMAATDRGAILVVDEAYIEYTSPGETISAVGHVRGGRPVVVLRSFSKLYGLAGLRCGYAMAPPQLCDQLRTLKNVLVFNVNRLALVAADATLTDSGFRDDIRGRARRALTAFQDWLSGEPWAATVPSVTNFALVELPWPASVVAAELAHHRILVRDCTDLGMPNHVRISMGLAHEMETTKVALRRVAAKLSDTRPTGVPR